MTHTLLANIESGRVVDLPTVTCRNPDMDLLTAIDTRASAVRLTEPAPSRSDIERILEAGVRAPDHGRLAPAHFVVLQGAGQERLGEALAAAFQFGVLGRRVHYR